MDLTPNIPDNERPLQNIFILSNPGVILEFNHQNTQCIPARRNEKHIHLGAQNLGFLWIRTKLNIFQRPQFYLWSEKMAPPFGLHLRNRFNLLNLFILLNSLS